MRKVFILPEYWGKSHIGACGWIRLLNPLMDPGIQSSFRIQYGYDFDKESNPDIVIFERLWHPLDFDLNEIRNTLKELKTSKVKIIYSLDDNLFDYSVFQQSDWFRSKHLSILHLFLHYADLVVVSTDALKERVFSFNPHIVVIKNVIQITEKSFGENPETKKLKFGYLLSPDNTTYLYQIIEPLKEILFKFRNEIVFEIIGHPSPHINQKIFNELPVEFHHPPNASYPNYIKWLERCCDWNFGLAPMSINEFTICKSDMKFLDFSRLDVPGIYTDFTPYDAVKQSSAGIMAKDDWYCCIQEMIASPEKRKLILQNARNYIQLERNPQIQVLEWLDVFNSLV